MHNDYLSSADAAQMATLMRITPQTMHRFALSHNERNRCTQLAINFYRLHIPDFPELKSFDVLRQVYDSEWGFWGSLSSRRTGFCNWLSYGRVCTFGHKHQYTAPCVASLHVHIVLMCWRQSGIYANNSLKSIPYLLPSAKIFETAKMAFLSRKVPICDLLKR